MTVEMSLIANCDDAVVFWRIEKPIKDCWGFAIERERSLSLDDHELPIRRVLSGVLRERMLELLKDAKQKKQHVFGALYELEDEELVEALAKLGSRGHLVLANGSIQKLKRVKLDLSYTGCARQA